jgi:glycosyltransferase involved in cell wall biosynthesis
VRILITTSQRNVIGGVEKYLQSLAPSLLDRGHSVALLYEHELEHAAETIDPPKAGLPAWCSRVGRNTCLEMIAGWDPEIVYAHGLEDPSLEAALTSRYPTIFYAHTYGGTCISGRKCHLWPRPQPCKRQFGPQCLLVYYPRRCGGLNPTTAWRMFREQSRRNANLQRYEAVLVASQHMYQELQRHGVSRDRLHLLPLPPTDIAMAHPPERTPQGRVLFLGRLVDVKGVRYLLEAIPLAERKLGRALEVTIAGDGAERGKLEALARQRRVAAEFVGWTSGPEKLNLLRRADLLAVPSLWPEPFGLVGIEGGCLGLPAVGFAVGGIPDWLIPGVSGELAPGNPPTIEGLAEAMVRALKDLEHYRRLSRGAWEVAQRYSLDRHLSQLESIFALSNHQSACLAPQSS